MLDGGLQNTVHIGAPGLVDPISVLEAALLCAKSAMHMDALLALFDEAVDELQIKAWLEQLQIDWARRGLELVCVSTGWRFQSRAAVLPYLGRLEPDRSPRYSRAAMEILAVIAYRQPVTRGDIEDIRGVAVNSQIVRQLEERGWIEVIGHRESVGRPALFATTPQFLDDLGLHSLRDLPEIGAVGDSSLQQLGLALTAAPVSAESVSVEGTAAESFPVENAQEPSDSEPADPQTMPDAERDKQPDSADSAEEPEEFEPQVELPWDTTGDHGQQPLQAVESAQTAPELNEGMDFEPQVSDNSLTARVIESSIDGLAPDADSA